MSPGAAYSGVGVSFFARFDFTKIPRYLRHVPNPRRLNLVFSPFRVKHLLVAALLLGAATLPAAAQSQQEAQLAVRIQQLEEQIRLLTGQVEGLQFQLTQMQTLIERQTEDNEFRFQQLEGGAAPGKPQAATEPGAQAPAGLPQAPALDSGTTAGADRLPEGDVLTAPGDVPVGEAPMDFNLGDSNDPLVGSNAGPGELGNLGAGRPLDLSLGGTAPQNGDANAQFAAGYDAIVRGDYAFAEDQFRQFIQLYPDDPQAADATNWLGEALIQRGEFAEAADVLVTGYQKYQNDPRAPDMLLRLGAALAGAGDAEMACRTFAEIPRRYPSQSGAFNDRLASEQQRAQCA